jgi:hypothetical protein
VSWRDWTCDECGAPLEVAYRVARWTRTLSGGGHYVQHYRCAVCLTKEKYESAKGMWDWSVERGTPGTLDLGFRSRAVADPDGEGWDPLAGIEVAECVCCGQWVAPPVRVRERSEVVWCGSPGCRSGSRRLAKRLAPKEPRVCACGCGEVFVPRRSDARFVSAAHRARSWRGGRAG